MPEDEIMRELKRSDIPVSRSRLVMVTRTSDREVRKAVKRLVKKGNPILSSSRVCGYWIAKNGAEIIGCMKEIRARIISLEEDYEALQGVTFGEVELFGDIR